MTTTLETLLPTSNGLFLLWDVAADTSEDQRPAFRALRIPGSRAAHHFKAVGPVLIVRCGHQYAKPHVRIEVLTAAPTDDPPWRWEERMQLASPSGAVVLDGDLETQPEPIRIELTAGPGTYDLVKVGTGWSMYKIIV